MASIAEVDARRLYVPAGYASMYLYCVRELHFCEQAAFKRIRAARAARRFPAIFDALANGRLNLSAVVLLTPHLTEETATELLAAATHKTNAEIERLLAERFPRPDLPTLIQSLASPPVDERLSVRTVGTAAGQPISGTVGALDKLLVPGPAESPTDHLAPGIARTPVMALDPGPVAAPARRPKVTPLSLERFGVQFTMGQSMRDKLHEAQELLSHRIPSGDIPAVLELGLEALIEKLRKSKFAATDRPRPGRRRLPEGGRHVPADVRRAVRERDGGQCTFVSDTGHRCGARRLLEFDHIDPVARGGRATVERMRLRCRAHNQYEAERVFGSEFMNEKRQSARRATAGA